MESDHNIVDNGSTGGSGGTPASSRWNPTKEQITMLENLYMQGIRTPSADQIQQITSRLRPFGHIEGKNVFYWFQNHKARQRQKQKQESLAYVNRFIHRTTTHPIFPTHSCSHVVCGPYYVPVQSEIVYSPHYHNHHHYPKVAVSGGIRRRPSRTQKMEKLRTNEAYLPQGSHTAASGHYGDEGLTNRSIMISNSNNQETLALFPLRPTGILQGRQGQNPCGLFAETTPTRSSTPSSSSEAEESQAGDQQHFYNFFSAEQSFCDARTTATTS
ncbi:hypothetical protein FNV43_RR04331 [Rhamnella rubrinervis]|uniref:Homeobox domain-containing protein n=1 Tax=Rhamnella rubrinervis TaxID=2594499 RepID=A0A8K0MQH5_9ROSA|nr:hypothetical protein FNV43_RR04331 [Rhamnella rubrinervis]